MNVSLNPDPELASPVNFRRNASYLLWHAEIVRSIIALYRGGHLNLFGRLAPLDSQVAIRQWLDSISPGGFRVLVQPPPTVQSTPQQVLRYLARYISGGPISNSRLVADVDGMVTFMARSLERPKPGVPPRKVPVEIPGVEFAYRWMLHILPKYLYRVRHYGELSNPHRAEYLDRCKKLLAVERPSPDPELPAQDGPMEESQTSGPPCPKCGHPMTCVERTYRPSWKDTMNGEDRPAWYSRDQHYSDSHQTYATSHPP